MTAPYSPLVLGPAALLTAPALWATLVTGSMPFETGLTRFAVAVAVVWLGVSLLGTLLAPGAPPATRDAQAYGVGTTGPASTSPVQVSDPTS